jgi:hypothetical protein
VHEREQHAEFLITRSPVIDERRSVLDVNMSILFYGCAFAAD